MKAAEIIEQARQLTGLHAFDSESFREGLDLIADTIEHSPRYTDAGREAITGVCIYLLANRLRVADYAHRHPDILDKPIERPVFVLGAPRTGTTLTSHLLSTDPARRSLLRWEGMDSVPPPTDATLYTDPRCEAMRQQDNAALQSSSDIHHEAADTPTECVIIHGQDMKAMVFDVCVEDPAYSRWILETDTLSAYRYHKLQLQVAGSRTTGIWQLKAPSHALFIRSLRAVYPDARIVWTHRDPYTAFASLCSLTRQYRGQFAEVDVERIGPQNIRQFWEHIARPRALQQEEGPDSIYNLHYARMVADPIGEMRRLYAWLGDDFTPAAEAGMRGWVEANPQAKFGKHRYTLEEFGVSVPMLREHFGDYVERYDVKIDARNLTSD